ncbi:hypothetical protein PR048_030758 [Dryococelus australis]|uniref:Uncharacterized protein n=1 Tax=Dryococelus australis TaxID=614101 RepID=A0ABQ9GCM5_9NEOP|nr:hypothetical protein PR048_030758 [Dryococelus australis]
MKDEYAGHIITHFVGLHPKLYAYVVANEQCIRKSKGVKPNLLQSLRHEYNRDSLKNCTRVIGTQYQFRMDDKWYSEADGISTLPWGNYRISDFFPLHITNFGPLRLFNLEVGAGHDGLMANICEIPGESIESDPLHTFTEEKGSKNLKMESAVGRRLKADIHRSSIHIGKTLRAIVGSLDEPLRCPEGVHLDHNVAKIEYFISEKKARMNHSRQIPWNIGVILERHDVNTARLARRSDGALAVRVSVARIAPSLLDLGRAAPSRS